MLTPDFLQQRFFTSLERRLRDLSSLVDRLTTSDADFETLTRGLHSLAGIGGTYGFPGVTDIARDAEHFCTSMQRPVRRQDVETLRNAVAALDELRMSIAA